jgi:hypothetical protein
MSIDTYKKKVIAFFKSGEATEEHWQELGDAMLWISEENNAFELSRSKRFKR